MQATDIRATKSMRVLCDGCIAWTEESRWALGLEYLRRNIFLNWNWKAEKKKTEEDGTSSRKCPYLDCEISLALQSNIYIIFFYGYREYYPVIL
jgi:hypothetical protein